MIRIPDGLAHALRGIADRLDAALGSGREKAGEVAIDAIDRAHFSDVFLAQWMATCEQAAREIRIAIEVWSKPIPRARRGGRR